MELWVWDKELFRAIHRGLQRDWLDPFMVVATFSGLGYVQFLWLLLATHRKRLGTSLVVALCLVLAFVSGLVEHSVLASVSFLLGAALTTSLKPRVAVSAIWALLVSGLIRIILVPMVGRQRPSNFEFAKSLEDVYGMSSFPSGHTTTTFAIATVVCWTYAKTKLAWLAWIFFGWACLVGLSRVYVIGSLVFFVFRARGAYDQETIPIDRNLA